MISIFNGIKIKSGVFCLALTSFLCSPSIAGINLKNGNFYISYTDIILKGQTEIKITRTYNSKSTRKGWFGYGWGSDFETFLQTTTEGSIQVRENGSGSITSFEPTLQSDKYKKRLEKSVNIIAEVFSNINPDSELSKKEVLEKLHSDKEFREDQWAKGIRKGILSPNKIKEGTKFINRQYGIQFIYKTDNGFIRKFSDGKEESFDNSGRLTEIHYKNGDWINLTYYDVKQVHQPYKIKQIINNNENRLFFFFGDKGTVERIVSNSSDTAQFHYNTKSNLTFSKDANGNIFKFEYDKLHNLTKILYSDGSKMIISYDPKTSFTQSISNRYGETINYEYGANNKNPDLHYWTTVTKEKLSGELVTNKYEYFIEVLPDGGRFTKKIIQVINGNHTETEYNKHNKPVYIRKGDRHAKFQYDDKGFLIFKETESETTEVEYHPVFNKIVHIETRNKDSKKDVTWSRYDYNENGEVVFGELSNGKSVAIKYNLEGNIKSMETKNDKLNISYNKFGQPSQIDLEKKGKLSISYNPNGEIVHINSDKGPEITAEITSIYLQLINILKPSGVDLGI